MMMTMGSLFDGIGGFPLAAVRNGIIPLWASEIEAFPIAVTKIRFPEMLHVGDITKLNGGLLPPVDVICGGSPCQDLSVAGQRAGLAGERSGLFMDQVRITKEMRIADEQRNVPAELIRPRYLVWENVPGAFSSADGEDFRAVIEEIVRIKDNTCNVPRPESGRWESAGSAILGNEFSLAWRVLDAQYWGVPQRRRRIFLIADFGGNTAPKILFEQDSLLGNTSKSEKQRKGTASSAQGSIDDTGRTRMTELDTEKKVLNDRMDNDEKINAFHINQRDELIDLDGISGALLATRNMQMQTFVTQQPLICLNDHGGERMDITEEMTPTLRAGMAGHQPLIMASQQGGAEIGEGICPTITSAAGTSGNNQPVRFENHAKDSRYNGPLEVAPTVTSIYGTGGNNVPLVGKPVAFSLDSKESNSMKSSNPYSGCRETDVARTIDTTNPDPSKNQGGIAILQETICIAGNTIDREPENGGNGLGCQPNISYTITTSDRHAVYSRQRSDEFSENDVAATQSARQYKDATDLICQPEIFGQSQYGNYAEGCATLRTQGGDNGGGSENLVKENKQNLIRRLTPLECERLQEFPDYWTLIPGASDSARYKALGNSVAIPCVEFVLRGIAYFLRLIHDKQEE